eukprot:jgi/Tetstr1/430542/TSEL_020340.t1
MKKMDRRMTMVTLTSNFGMQVRPMLPSAGTRGVVCVNWTCEEFLHFAETVAVLVLGSFVLEARIKFLRAGMDPDFPSLPLWRPGFVEQWEAASADDAVDIFEGTGPGCRGAAVQAGTSGAPATWTDCEVALAK